MRALTVHHTLPDGLLELPADQLHTQCTDLSLFHLEGRRKNPLFVSLLLHGNETTGWEALRLLLKRYQDKELPRSLSFLVGNVEAAAVGVRHLPNQPDYNRIWLGGEGAEQQMVQRVIEEMRQRKVFASVDLHNNTGRNPHYGCVNRLEPQFLQLATLFSRTVVYFIRPAEVQSMAMAALCPAVTIECGRPGEAHGVEHAVEFLDACLRLSEIPNHPVAVHDLDLFHTVATVKIPSSIEFGFGIKQGDLCLSGDLDRFNFQEIPAGTAFGRICSDHLNHIEAWDESGEDVGDRFFMVEDGELRTRRDVMPSMLTRDVEVIRQDCLCYLMERLSV